MKISLNLDQHDGASQHAIDLKSLEHDILATKEGDWTAKANLTRTFTPLLKSLAEKRSSDVPQINEYIEAGKEGLVAAAKKYKPGIGAERFRIFALDFIEGSMDRVDKAKKRKAGFFGRLFGHGA